MKRLNQILVVIFLFSPNAFGDADEFEIYMDSGDDTNMEVFEEPKPGEKHPTIKSIKIGRKPASVGSMVRLNQNCNMRLDATEKSEIVLTIPKGRKIWLEPQTSGWKKGYHKSGFGFLSPKCF